MSRLATALLSIFLISTFSQISKAQDKMIARDGFEEGYKAVQFGIGNNFRLTNFGDANFSFVKFTSSEKAVFIRGSISNQFAYENYESDSAVELPNSNTTTSEDSRSTRGIGSDFKVYLGKINYLKTESDVLPFFSRSLFLGARINSSSNDRNTTAEDSGSGNTNDFDNDDSAFEFSPMIGSNLGFGVEYFVAKNISLHAQTTLQFSYRFRISNNENTRESVQNGTLTETRIMDRNRNNHVFSVGTGGILFGLSAYF
jgi:hypothetical protein